MIHRKLIRRKPLKHDSLTTKREATRIDRVRFFLDWGLQLTICVVAVTGMGDVVAVSDEMVSFNDQIPVPDFVAKKQNRLCDGWIILFATDDITRVGPIIRRAQDRLKRSSKFTGPVVQDAVCNAYRDALNEETTRRFLWPLGIESLQEFRDKGLTQFGPRTFSQMRRKIEKFDLRVQFLIAGFDQDLDRAEIYEISNPGIASDHNVTGYWAIGSGAPMALASITRSYPLNWHGAEEVVFRLCEAKFSAETASGVGKSTTVVVIEKAKRLPLFLYLLDEHVAELRRIWGRKEAVRSPPEAMQIIRERLVASQEFFYDPTE